MYFYIAAENGLIGLAVFLWMSIVIFRQGIRSFSSDSNEIQIFACALIIGLSGLYFHALFENFNLGHPIFILLSFLAGCLTAACQIKDYQRKLEQ